jgi:hypothetical protein
VGLVGGGTPRADGETRHERALRLLVERLEELRHRQAFGRVEVHVSRGQIEMIRTVEDERIAY